MENQDQLPEQDVLWPSARFILAAFVVLALLALVVALFVSVFVSTEVLTFASLAIIVLGLLPLTLALLLAARIAARFAQHLYDLPRSRDAWRLLEVLLFGRPDFPPTFSVARNGKVHHGDAILEHFGGPGKIFITSDSAVILQKNGRLTRLLRQPGQELLEPFEKVWDVFDLRPRRWVYDVPAITKDGVPIVYAADVRFQIDLSGAPEEQEAAILRAATCTWIRDAWRTDPDRLMTWPKRVIISATEGAFRNILARYELDDLLEESCRTEVRAKLEQALRDSLPGLGVRLLGLELGNLKVEDKVVQQWKAAWLAERTHQMHVRIADGMAERARALEKAKAGVRKQVLAATLHQLEQVQKEGKGIPAQLVLLSCIEVIKQTQFSLNMYLPRDILNVLEAAERHLRTGDTAPAKTP